MKDFAMCLLMLMSVRCRKKGLRQVWMMRCCLSLSAKLEVPTRL